MAVIKIQRTSEINNQLLDFRILIDGKKVGNISDGQSKEFQVAPGKHALLIKSDWARSNQLLIECAEAETPSFIIGGFWYGQWFYPAGYLVLLLLSVLLYTVGFIYLIYLLIPAGLLVLNYATFFRRNHLTLSRKN